MQLLVISDGHGGARHWRSDAGSHLACAVALREGARSLAAAATAEASATGSGAAGWGDWLERQLPARIVAAWRLAVLEHLRTHPEDSDSPADGEPATPEGAGQPFDIAEEEALQAYGATLGLLVLTPRWWGHTGLGDWDLVRLEGRGDAALDAAAAASAGAALLSEEPWLEGGGEATFSLCMQRCERLFPSRSALHRLDRSAPPFQLLLSTDGIRKSCGSDADFLTLAAHLADLPAGTPAAEDEQLAEALDHISREGSGDDVTAVIAHWGIEPHPPEAPSGLVGEGGGGPLILQPPPPPPPPAPPSPGPGRPAAPAAAGPQPGNSDDPQARGARRSAPAKEPTGLSRATAGRRPIALRPGRLAVVVALLLFSTLLAGAAGLLVWRLRLGPFAPSPTAPPSPAAPPLPAAQPISPPASQQPRHRPASPPPPRHRPAARPG